MTTIEFKNGASKLCPDCLGQKGYGSIVDGWSSCPRCHGKGTITEDLPVATLHQPRMRMDAQGRAVLVGCECGWMTKPKIAAFDLDPEDDLVMHIALHRRGTLLDSDITPREREIEALEPRPGWVSVGMVHDEIEYEMTSQESTDYLIVHELERWAVPPSELKEFEQLTKAFRKSPGPLVEARRYIGQQHGGIHSDPFVRVLAFRAWGRRDLDWAPLLPPPKRIDRMNHRDPPMQNIPARKRTAKPTRAASLHSLGCKDPDCDGQCRSNF
jgi:hypothetical protein